MYKTMYEVKMYIGDKDWGGTFFINYIKAREQAEAMMNWAFDREKYHEVKYGTDRNKRLCVVFKPIIKHWQHKNSVNKYDVYILKVKVQ